MKKASGHLVGADRRTAEIAIVLPDGRMNLRESEGPSRLLAREEAMTSLIGTA